MGSRCVTYRKQGKYKCSCGTIFMRNEKDTYTISNRYDKLTPEEHQHQCIENINKWLSEKECPACGAMVKPISVYAI
jgi:hypothetical protein